MRKFLSVNIYAHIWVATLFPIWENLTACVWVPRRGSGCYWSVHVGPVVMFGSVDADPKDSGAALKFRGRTLVSFLSCRRMGRRTLGPS